MSEFKGFYSLETPDDLFQKLRHDFERIKSNPMDVYAAFDFVVSADHMVDWVYPDSCKSDKEQRANRNLTEKI